MSRSCDHLWKADAIEAGTLAAGDAASFQRHARACKECQERVRIDKRLRALADQLPTVDPGDLQIHRLRARILGDARKRTARPRPPWTQIGFAGAAALIVSVVAITFLVGRRGNLAPREEPFAGLVTAAPGTHWSQSRTAKVETLLLTQGELWVVVRKQTQDERFLVETPDGELEVRGTTFGVLVDGSSTRRVSVIEGLVILRLRDRPAVGLAAGQTWDLDAPGPSSAPPLVASASTIPSVAAKHAPPPLPAVRNPSSVTASSLNTEAADYERAMADYRTASYAEAAEGFRRFAAQHRDSGLLEDATFLEALSLTKAGHADAGSVAASRHLAEFPNSFHRREASLLVARTARDRGDCGEARRALSPWFGSNADTTIREALGECAQP
jgi:hypothetical protein